MLGLRVLGPLQMLGGIAEARFSEKRFVKNSMHRAASQNTVLGTCGFSDLLGPGRLVFGPGGAMRSWRFQLHGPGAINLSNTN